MRLSLAGACLVGAIVYFPQSLFYREGEKTLGERGVKKKKREKRTKTGPTPKQVWDGNGLQCCAGRKTGVEVPYTGVVQTCQDSIHSSQKLSLGGVRGSPAAVEG